MSMSLGETTTNCPVVRVEDGPWCRYADLSGGALRMGKVTFDARVEWVRETSSGAVAAFPDGTREPYDQNDRYSDWYGYGTSAVDAVDDARAKARKLGAGPGTLVVVEAFTLVRDRPLLPRSPRDPAPYGGRREYHSPPDDWLRPDDAWLEGKLAFDAASTGERFRWFETDLSPAPVRRKDVARAVLWSSANAEGSPEATALLEAALATLAEGLPPDVEAGFRKGWAEWVAEGCSRG